MELYQLRTFVAVADESHLTRAAEKLFISQPAVSAHVKALEEELGVALFTRGPRGMQLTREGQALLERARTIVALAAELAQAARALGAELTGELRLALHTDPDYLRVLPLLSRLNASHPKLVVHLRQSMSRTIMDEVRAGSLDGGFAFSAGPPQGELSGLSLGATELFVVAPPEWRGRIVGAGWEGLAGEPWVWFPETCPYAPLLEQCLGPLARGVRRVAVTDYEETLRALVKSGVGLSLMRQDEAERGEAAGEVCVWGGSGQMLELYFVHRRDREADPALRAVLSALREAWGFAPA